MKKKVVSAILVAAMAMSMVACGSEEAADNSNAGANGTEAAGYAERGAAVPGYSE